VTRIAPSILSADFANLARDIARIEAASDLLHIDVMDGHFVPNITIGAPVVKSLRRASKLFFDCHLMISDPGAYLEDFKNAGADSCSIHLEAGDTAEVLKQMRHLGLGVGLGVNPDTPFEAFEEHLGSIDMLLVMTVQPGFGGQAFREDVMPKLRRARDFIRDRGLQVSIEVDGGIDVVNGPVAAENGADTFVAGSAIFGFDDPAEAAGRIREAIDAISADRNSS
jgi:ribulose-phosphate 3-epimerase